MWKLAVIACVACSSPRRPVAQDPSPHQVGRVGGLEVLDWHGDGPVLVLLAGMGNSAHIFDDFAPLLVDRFHVIGITRRGFGASQTPATGYDVPTLSSDILRVLDERKIERAILVGHSIAGEEMTWLAANHPARVSALVYLDAAYDRIALREAIGRPAGGSGGEPPKPSAADLASPAAFASYLSRGMAMPIPIGEVLAQFEVAPDGRVGKSSARDEVIPKILANVLHPDYSRITAPVLALYAVGDDTESPLARFNANQREALAVALPKAKIVAIPKSRHYLFLTNRDAVLRELRAFFAGT